VLDIEALRLWIEQNPEWISISVFCIAFLESFAGIGLLIPGVILLAMVAVIANMVNVSSLEIIIWCYLGACIADILSFLIGHYFRNKVTNIWPFSKYPESLFKAKSLVKTYGIYAILIGRFIGPIRPVLPIIAGTLSMPKNKFIAIDLLSGIPWSCFYILPSYYLAASITNDFLGWPYLLGVIFLILTLSVVRKYFQ